MSQRVAAGEKLSARSVRRPKATSMRRQIKTGIKAMPNWISGLTLWLKADAGVTNEPVEFVSEIEISEAGEATSDGVYTRASGGTTTLTGPNGNYIEYINGDWFLYDDAFAGYTYTNNTLGLEEANWFTNEAGGGQPTALNSTDTGPSGVTLWADQSGRGNHAIAPSQREPSLTINAINGKPVLSFDGALDSMNLTSPVGGLVATYFIVCRALKTSAILESSPSRYIGINSDNLHNGFNRFIFSENDINNGFSGALAFSASPSYSITTRHIIGAAVQTGSGAFAYINGTAGFRVGTINGSITFDRIGGLSNLFEGNIAEIIVYNRALSVRQRRSIEAYLANKYAIY